MTARRLVLWLVLLVTSQLSCGYQLAGRGSFLPASIRVIGIPPFDSLVPRSEIVVRLTDEVTREFVSRGGYRITPVRSGADAVLEGTITGFVESPVAFDDNGRASRSFLTISAAVTMRDNQSDAILYDNPAFRFQTELDIDPEAGELFDRESAAIDDIARQFARSLVATIVEGF